MTRKDRAMPVTPKEASTLILMRRRSAAGGFEVLMVRRDRRSKFVPDAYVFPGGIMDEEDGSERLERLCSGLTAERARGVLEACPSREIALGSWVAAIRETFEEVGILLAYRPDGRPFSPDGDGEAERLATSRRLLIEGSLPFAEILEREGLLLACDRLHYFSHWITPEFLPLRYDVRFFLAEAPESQEALHDGIELTEHVWRTPAEILEDSRRGRFNMVLPTLLTIEELRRFGSPEEAIRSTRGRMVEGILTRIQEEDGELVEYTPDGRAFRNLPPSV
jgi:8-oxo-dGTP pyrophosphatase MutT (NUDIX family)